jgi:hypothetical protein
MCGGGSWFDMRGVAEVVPYVSLGTQEHRLKPMLPAYASKRRLAADKKHSWPLEIC